MGSLRDERKDGSLEKVKANVKSRGTKRRATSGRAKKLGLSCLKPLCQSLSMVRRSYQS